MSDNTLKKNLLYQSLYQAIMLIIPLVISPYVTRKLGADALGIYSFTYSIAYYFVIVSMLGIIRHGQRAIAEVRGDGIKLRKTFWGIFAFHVLISVVVTVLYVLFVITSVNENKLIYLVQGIYVLSAVFDITWLFYGLEEFRIVIRRNLIIKGLELTLILTLVRTPDDLWKYTIIMSSSVLIGQILLFPTAISTVPYISISKRDIIHHIKPMLVLWISVIAASMYTVFDKTLIGLLTETSNVAYYEYADKIVRVPVFLLATISTVTYPRMCNLVARNNDIDQQKTIFRNSIILTSFIGFAAIAILVCSSVEFSMFYYGESFRTCGEIMKYLSIVIILISIGDIIRTQIMIPRKMDKEFVICICINAVINLLLTAILIPKLGVYGAVIGTCCAELSGVVLNMCICKNKNLIKIRSLVFDIIPFACIAIFVCLVITTFGVRISVENHSLKFFILASSSGLLYLAISFVYITLCQRQLLVLIRKNRS